MSVSIILVMGVIIQIIDSRARDEKGRSHTLGKCELLEVQSTKSLSKYFQLAVVTHSVTIMNSEGS